MDTSGQEHPKGIIEVEIDRDLEELIPSYLANRRRDIRDAHEAIEKMDFETVARLGHTMKGSGGGYGFDFISALGANLEQSGKDHALDDIKKQVAELTDYLDRLRIIYR